MASAAQQVTQYKEEARLAQVSLEDAQRKLQSCIFLDKQKAETIQELQKNLQKLQKEFTMAEEELTVNRYHRPMARRSCARTTVGGYPGAGARAPFRPSSTKVHLPVVILLKETGRGADI